MTKNLATILSELRYDDDAKIVEQVCEQRGRVARRMSAIRHKLVVMSGKGGVGKSVTTVQLGLALASAGHRVGLLDVDLNGPCVARMLGMERARFTMTSDGAVPPEGPHGIKVASIDFFNDTASPLRWKGPSESSPAWLGTREMTAVRELISDVAWGELDFLIADLPPGAAADKPPLIAGLIPDLTGAVVVTTPSEVASAIVRRSIVYAQDLGILVLGVVENLCAHRCRHCGSEAPLFPGAVDAMCRDLEVPLLGRVAFEPALARGEVVRLDAYRDIAGRVASIIDARRLLAQTL